MTATLAVIAKAPVAGRSKTRLCPPCSPQQAADLATAALRDTLEAVLAVRGGARRVLVLDGTPGSWLPAGFEIVAQRGEGLAARLAVAFDDLGGPTFLVGMDTPQLTPRLLSDGLHALEDADASLGLAPDGGYWGIGLRAPDPAVFAGVPMSVGRTGAVQRERLRALGLRTAMLPALRDVDLIDDARAVAALAPRTRFAAALASIDASRSVGGMTPLAAVDLYGRSLDDAAGEMTARSSDGRTWPLPVHRYLGLLTAADEDVLARALGPVLDIGCGPGRHVVALARRGALAVGVDVSPVAVRIARERGALVHQASVFDRLPGAGTWGTALLLDGNIGIGGRPTALLTRLARLLRPGGLVLAELEPAGTPSGPTRLRLETDDGVSDWFAWAHVGEDAIGAHAAAAGLAVTEIWEVGGRCFASLIR